MRNLKMSPGQESNSPTHTPPIQVKIEHGLWSWKAKVQNRLTRYHSGMAGSAIPDLEREFKIREEGR